MALILIMVDGVGLAQPGSHNPVANSFPQLTQHLSAPLTGDLNINTSSLLARPIDATLEIPGLPQSGTGHTSIYGGFNASAANGRHQPSYPTIAMREELARHNVLGAALSVGCRVAWANAYLPGYAEAVERRRMRHTAGTWAALSAGLPLRGVDELRDGTAIAWDVTQRLARTRPGCTDLPLIAPEDAAARLVHLSRIYDFVAFETYLPDLAAHERIPFTVGEALQAVDGLLAGVLAERDAETTLVVTSDHGNSEDATTRIHTRNPVPLIVAGPSAPYFTEVRAIDGIAGAILNALRDT